MKEGRIKEAIATQLRSWGFGVELLAEREKPTPDLLATKGQRFLIEIKTKEDDSAVVDDRRKRLAAGEVVGVGTSFTPQNTISRVIKRGCEQLAAYPPEKRDFSLLWLMAVGSAPEGQYEQFRGTLYGLGTVVGPDDYPLMPTYYLRHSAFFRWQTVLDGAIISTLQSAELCLNTYSPRWADLRKSELGQPFGHALVDPLAREEEGIAYLADCDLDRNDEGAVLRYVQRKYDRGPLTVLNLGMQSAYVELPTRQS